MAWFTYHQCFPSQGAHSQYPGWDMFATFGVFLLDVFEFSDVVDFKLAAIARLVTAEFALVGVESVKNLVSRGDWYLYDSLSYLSHVRLVLFLDGLIEVRQGFRTLFRLVRYPEYLPCARFLLAFDFHPIFAQNLGDRAFFLTRSGFQQAVVVVVHELSNLLAYVCRQAIVVVETPDFRIVLREKVQQGCIYSGVVVDRFSVFDERFLFLLYYIPGYQQLNGLVGGAFLHSQSILSERCVFSGLGYFVAKEAYALVRQVSYQGFFHT